jgi:hypothetical protein
MHKNFRYPLGSHHDQGKNEWHVKRKYEQYKNIAYVKRAFRSQ